MAVYNITNNAHSVSELYPDQQYQESFVFMDEKEYEYFEERTAIMEYEGGIGREEAEQLAYDRILYNRKVYSRAS